MSVYLRNARAFPDRAGAMQRCEDVRAGCTTAAPDARAPVAGTPVPIAAPAPPVVPMPLAAAGFPPAMPLLGTVLLSALGALAIACRFGSRSRRATAEA